MISYLTNTDKTDNELIKSTRNYLKFVHSFCKSRSHFVSRLRLSIYKLA